MSSINFYHLTRNTLKEALPRLLEKILEHGLRAVVIADSQERVEEITSNLWTYTPLSFLPHGNKKDGFEKDQPIWVTSDFENPNQAQILVLTYDVIPHGIEEYDRCLDVFDGNNAESLSKARQRWKEYKKQGHEVVYWKQDEKGIWTRVSE
jgi:DNA polymerase-3 subunit chi